VQSELEASVRKTPVTLLLGPRQVGKTTLARLFAEEHQRFDIENPLDLARLLPDPFGVLANQKGLVVLDEVQMMPELFQYIRVIVDEPTCQARFLLTGSASPTMVEQSAQSLAGRVHLMELGGFSLRDVEHHNWKKLWFCGGYPQAYLGDTLKDTSDWHQDYLKTFVLRDIQQLSGSRLSAQVLSRFLLLLAHYHGQAWNRNDIASNLGISPKTVDRYMDVFLGTYLIRELRPFFSNINKRMRKTPRYYIRDSGLLHCLLRIKDPVLLRSDRKVGASWEGYGIEQVIRHLGCTEEDCFFWRSHAGAEIDLIIQSGERLIGVEFKASSVPKLARGAYTAMKDLSLEKLYVVYPGDRLFEIEKNVIALPIKKLDQMDPL